MSSPPENREEPQKPNGVTEENIQKAIRFWCHPSLAGIPSDQKRHYLKERGVTDSEIYKAWERIAETEAPDISGSSAGDGSGELKASVVAGAGLNQADPFANQNAPRSHPIYPQNYGQPTAQYYGQKPLQEEEDGPLSLIQGASLVTLGGMIGLTAAAASRWLNGGDFEVFPAPKYPNDVAEQRSLFLQRLEAENQEEEEAALEEEEDDIFLDSQQGDEEVAAALVQEKLLQQVESIAENLRSNVEVQEKILKKLTTSGSSSITDQSMNLLRSQESGSDNENKYSQSEILQLWVELVEIKAELRSLHSIGTLRETGAKLEEQAKQTLASLENCIDQINSRLGARKSTKTTNPALEESAVPAQEAPESTRSPCTDVTEEPIAHNVEESIGALVRRNDEKAIRVGCQLLFLYIVNLYGKPSNPRYRKIYTSNESFKNVEVLKGGKELLFAVGFEEQTGCLEWLPNATPEKEKEAMEKLKQASAALEILKSGKLSNALIESALATIAPATSEAKRSDLSPTVENPMKDSRIKD
eukprot:scaffold6124_cov122-Cylindrotheca_fusiformis.AAC.20